MKWADEKQCSMGERLLCGWLASFLDLSFDNIFPLGFGESPQISLTPQSSRVQFISASSHPVLYLEETARQFVFYCFLH